MQISRKLKKWFSPGIEIKRWISLTTLGIAILVLGVIRLVKAQSLFIRIVDIFLVSGGVFLIIAGIRSMVHSFLSIFLPYSGEELVDIIYKKRYLQKGPKIVALGGGHGLATLLLGLKEYTANLSAIVTVADSGGSSGRLREEFDMLPPGDIRNCLVALANSPSLMGELFQFRFKEDSELKGHNFGNLFITAMTQVTGDFKKAVEESSKVLAIRGKVLPSTLHKVSLVAEYKDGVEVEGEADIPKRQSKIERVYLKSLNDDHNSDIMPTAEVNDAKSDDQFIVIGPGSLYTSILPNLVIQEITEAIMHSSALKIFICNVMTQEGETDAYSAASHLKSLIQHTNKNLVDCCIVNTKKPPRSLLSRYRAENSFPTTPDIPTIKKMGYKVISGNFISSADYVRHDSSRLAKAIIETFRREYIRKEI